MRFIDRRTFVKLAGPGARPAGSGPRGPGLHHLVFYGSYESMRFLIDRGIDMTIQDYRWNSTAQGWARYGATDEKMAQWLDEPERQRQQGR